MTYILGLKQPGFNAIISDMRVTRRGARPSENAVVKTGVLFDGCIFGRTGSVYHSERFIREFQESMKGSTATCDSLWQDFKRYVKGYSFPAGADTPFQLVLSTRASGQPEFYVLDRVRGLVPVQEGQCLAAYGNCCVVSYGRGKGFLDPRVSQDFASRLELIERELASQKGLTGERLYRVMPYCLCLWLSELSLAFEASLLQNQYGVGGIFHFIWQNSETEQRQGPAVYILSSLSAPKSVYSFVFRVVPVQGGVYVEEVVPDGRMIRAPDGQLLKHFEYALLDTLDRACGGLDGLDVFPDSEGRVPEHVVRAIQEQIAKKVDASPFYEFCGFGFADPTHRISFRFGVSENGRREDIFDPHGRLAPVHRRYLAQVFSACSSRQGR